MSKNDCCNQDCNQGRMCPAAHSNAQFGWLYFWMLICVLVAFAGLHEILKPPQQATTVEQYADKICQELYGPQVGHKWVDNALMCETARGEIVSMRRDK